MSQNIKQWKQSSSVPGSNPYRNIDLSDGTPAIDGDVIVFGALCDSAGNEVLLATSTLQTTLNNKVGEVQATPTANTLLGRLKDIDDEITSLNAKVTAANTGAVVVSSSALPTDAATATNQATGNASLSSIDGKMTACNTGNVTIGAALPAGTNNIGDVDVLSLPALPAGANTIGSLNNISGTISLPTGAATAAKQPALGTAGTASADVITIQGIDSMTPVNVAGTVELTGTAQEDIATIAGFTCNTSNIAGAVTATPNAIDLMQHNVAYSMPTGWATFFRASASAPSDVGGDNYAVMAWALRNGSQVVNLAVGGTLVTSSAGLPVTPASGASFTVGSITTWGNLVDDAAFTPGTTRVLMAGFQADETSTDSVDEGDGGAARMTLDRKIIVTDQPHTQGGCDTFQTLDLDETEEDVKTSRGQVYGGFVTNRTTSPLYLKFYNATAANVIVGTTTPKFTLEIPANAADHISALLNMAGGKGIEFDTAISVACTTGFANSDTGAPATNALLLTLFYK